MLNIHETQAQPDGLAVQEILADQPQAAGAEPVHPDRQQPAELRAEQALFQLSADLLAALEVKVQRLGVAALKWVIPYLDDSHAAKGAAEQLAEAAQPTIPQATPELVAVQHLLAAEYAVRVESITDWTLPQLTNILQALQAWRQLTHDLGACWGPLSFAAAFGGGVDLIKGGPSPDKPAGEDTLFQARYEAFKVIIFDLGLTNLDTEEYQRYFRSLVVHELAHCWDHVSWIPFYWNMLSEQMRREVQDTRYPSPYGETGGANEDFAESFAATIYPTADPNFLADFQGSQRHAFIKHKLYKHGRRHR